MNPIDKANDVDQELIMLITNIQVELDLRRELNQKKKDLVKQLLNKRKQKPKEIKKTKVEKPMPIRKTSLLQPSFVNQPIRFN